MHHAAPVMVVSGAEVYSFAYSCIPVYIDHALSRAHCRRYTAYSSIQYTGIQRLQVYSAYTPPLGPLVERFGNLERVVIAIITSLRPSHPVSAAF